VTKECGAPGARILIVEDDALLALDLKWHMERAGFSVIGPAASASKALELLAQTGCDAAILDVHLGRGQTSVPVAQELRSRGTPFVTATAYSHEHRPEAYSGFPVLSKPVRAADVIAELQRCLALMG
jgi:DNA-binding response OmpR family regulator